MAEEKLSFILEAKNNAKAALEEIKNQLEGVKNKLDGASESSKNLNKSSELIKPVATAIAGLSLAAGAFGVASLKAAGNFQQSQVAFTTMLGSAEKANTLLQQITTFASDTPFELTDIQNASKSMIAFGIASEDVIPSLTNIGNIASGIGVPIQDLAVIYGKARTQGTLFAEDINQLTERGVPIIAQLAKQFNVAEGDVKKLVSSGKVGFSDLKIAFEQMGGAGGQFGGLMDAQSKTLNGSLSNLADAWNQFLVTSGQPLLETATVAIQGFTSFIQNTLPQILTNFQNFFGYLENNQWIIYTVAGAIGGVLVMAFVASLPAIWGAVTAFGALAIAMAPWIIGGAIIGGIVAGIVWIVQNWELVKTKASEIWNAILSELSIIWNSLTSTVQNVFSGITEFFTNIWNNISLVFNTMSAFAVGAVIMIFNAFGIDIVGIWGKILLFFQTLWNNIKSIFNIGLNLINQLWTSVWNGMVGFFTPIIEGIKTALETMWKWISDKFTEYTKPITDLWSALWNGLGNVVTGVFEGVKNTVKSMFNWVIDKVNGVIDSINIVIQKGADTLHIKAITIPNIPALATGGIISSPTLAMIGEGNNDEAVVPLPSNWKTNGFGSSPSVIVNVMGGYYLSDQAAEEFGDIIMEKLSRTMKLA